MLAGRQEGHPACKKWGDGGGWHWLVRMELRPAGWSVCLPVLIFPCIIKSRRFLASAHPGGPRKMAVKQLWCVVVALDEITLSQVNHHLCTGILQETWHLLDYKIPGVHYRWGNYLAGCSTATMLQMWPTSDLISSNDNIDSRK